MISAGCTGQSSPGQATTPTTATATTTETPTVVAEPTATPTPEPIVVTEADRIAAAMAAFEADPQPTELIAYDYLEPLVSTNQIRLTVCGWTGETSSTTSIKSPTASAKRSTQTAKSTSPSNPPTPPPTPAPTPNSSTPLQATRDFDNYWRGVLEDPTSFDENELPPIMSPELAALGRDVVNDWASQGLMYRNSFLDGELPSSAAAEVLMRSYTEQGADVLEFISCRQQSDTFGLYSGNILVDDFRQESSNGPHGLARYVLIRRDDQWVAIGLQDRSWLDCFEFDGGWIAGANLLFADPVPWEVVPS